MRAIGPRVSRRPASLVALLALALATLLAAGCASLPPPADNPPSLSLADPLLTPLGRAVAAAQPDARRSGFRLIEGGEDALDARRLLARRARLTLDIQYYIVRDDAPTRALFKDVRAAADRGVRVRVLIDDMQTEGLDAALASLAAHRNVELRLYNPFPGQRANTATRILSSLGSIRQLNRRMHNKAFIADNAVAITGGRNLGAEYFLRDEVMNFADLDVLAAGPVAREMSASFDRFWNSPTAYPAEMFLRASRDAPPVGRAHGMIPDEPPGPPDAPVPTGATPPGTAPTGAASAGSASPGAASAAGPTVPLPPPPPAQARGATLRAQLGPQADRLVWAQATLMADEPHKIEFGPDAGDEAIIADDVASLLRSARREVLIVSPYLVPGDWGMDLLRELRARNVRVRILTNSLAATDVPIVHSGYARYRKPMLEMGVELHELAPTPARARGWIGLFGSSRASLHAKALVVDGRLLLVGSLNLDPRSLLSNTEMGVVIDSRTLSAQIQRLFDQSVAPGNAFRPQLDEAGAVFWTATLDGSQRRFDAEPAASTGRLLIHRLLGPLAPEGLL